MPLIATGDGTDSFDKDRGAKVVGQRTGKVPAFTAAPALVE